MDPFFEKLASTPTMAKGASEAVKLLAKRAAGLYINKEAETLNAAVRSLVAEHPELNREQIAHVAQQANQAAWDVLFHQGGQNAEFEPASGDEVLAGLAERAQTVVAPNFDYLMDPPPQPMAEASLEELASAFGVKLEDSAPIPQMSSGWEEKAEGEKVASAEDFLRHSLDRIEPLLREEEDRLYQHVKQAHLQHDHGILQISRAVAAVLDSPTFAVDLMQKMANRLLADGIQVDRQLELKKMAQVVVVDDDHPLLVSAVAVEKLAQACHKATVGHGKMNAKRKALLRHKGR